MRWPLLQRSILALSGVSLKLCCNPYKQKDEATSSWRDNLCCQDQLRLLVIVLVSKLMTLSNWKLKLDYRSRDEYKLLDGWRVLRIGKLSSSMLSADELFLDIKLVPLIFSGMEMRSSWSAPLRRSGRDAANLTKRAVHVGAQVHKNKSRSDALLPQLEILSRFWTRRIYVKCFSVAEGNRYRFFASLSVLIFFAIFSSWEFGIVGGPLVTSTTSWKKTIVCPDIVVVGLSLRWS